MGLRSVDVPGLGPNPLDVRPDPQLDPLQIPALEIPDRPAGETRPERRTNSSGPWSDQDRVQSGRGSQWETGVLERWNAYSGGQGRPPAEPEVSRAAIVIDGGSRGKTTLAQVAARQDAARAKIRHSAGTPNDTPAWRSLVAAGRQAAAFEEESSTAQPFIGTQTTKPRARRRVLLED